MPSALQLCRGRGNPLDRTEVRLRGEGTPDPLESTVPTIKQAECRETCRPERTSLSAATPPAILTYRLQTYLQPPTTHDYRNHYIHLHTYFTTLPAREKIATALRTHIPTIKLRTTPRPAYSKLTSFTHDLLLTQIPRHYSFILQQSHARPSALLPFHHPNPPRTAFSLRINLPQSHSTNPRTYLQLYSQTTATYLTSTYTNHSTPPRSHPT